MNTTSEVAFSFTPQRVGFVAGCQLLLLLLLGATPALAASDLVAPAPDYAPDRIVLQPKPGANRQALANFHAGLKATVLRSFEGLGGLQVVSLPAGETVPGLIAKYKQSGLVQFAEPDYFIHAALAPNDPKYVDGTTWGLYKMEAAAAWEVRTDATSVVVAVLDTGVNYTHEDLAANMWTNPRDGSHGWNALTGTSNPLDDQGHGSLVSGLLGAVGNNGKGLVGVAWKAQLMVCKCLNNATPEAKGSESDAAACFEYARTNGARIINASWGTYTNSQTISNAIYSAWQAGIMVVAAAGNNGRNVDVSPYYPASYGFDNVVSVGYTTNNDTLGQVSNYGATNVALFAPGAWIYSTFFGSPSTYLGGSYLEGSSFAAPYVSGALALLLAQYPQENYRQIIHRLLCTTDPLPVLAGKCRTGGRLNLRKALTSIVLTGTPASDGGAFQLHASALPNLDCVLQASSDLRSWSPLCTTNTGTSGAFDFGDGQFTNHLQRFYRVVTLH
jgi:subtilisin family serine protease